MRSLFVKIFLSFWITLILVGVTQEIANFMLRRDEDQWRARVMSLLPSEGKKAAEVYENFGTAKLEEYVNELQQRSSVQVYFMDGDTRPLLGQVPASVRERAKEANERAEKARVERERSEREKRIKRERAEERYEKEKMERERAEKITRNAKEQQNSGPADKTKFEFTESGQRVLVAQAEENREREAAGDESSLVMNGISGVAVQQVIGPSGQRYFMGLLLPRGATRELWIFFNESPVVRPLAIFLIGGVFCLLLTLHITRPLVQLRAAVSSFAGGHLQARVGKGLGRRRDEIGSLGRDFDRMAEQIESLVTAQRDLLGDVSHELRSPLARLIVALSLARKRASEEAGEYLDRIGLEADRLDKLIGQLLTLARIESGVDAGLRTTFDLTNLVHEVAADGDFEGRTRSRAVKVIAADPCTMSGLEEMLRSAIENVVRNAIRHTNSDTSVDITLKKQSNGRVSSAILEIRDHGPGVPESFLPEIFLPFRRAPGQSESELNGAGLGLAITERVVLLHKGEVRAANAVGGGLSVEIVLPLSTS